MLSFPTPIGNPVFLYCHLEPIGTGLARRHSLAIVLTEEARQFSVYKVVVGLADNVRFFGAEETFGHPVAGQIDAIHVLP